MDQTKSTMVLQELADAAREFQMQQTGRAPSKVYVVIDENMLEVTLHEALSPAEQALASTPEGATNLHEFYHQLFRNSAASLGKQVERITGRKICEFASQIDPGTGRIVHAFTTGATVQVILLDDVTPDDTFLHSDLEAPANMGVLE